MEYLFVGVSVMYLYINITMYDIHINAFSYKYVFIVLTYHKYNVYLQKCVLINFQKPCFTQS